MLSTCYAKVLRFYPTEDGRWRASEDFKMPKIIWAAEWKIIATGQGWMDKGSQ